MIEMDIDRDQVRRLKAELEFVTKTLHSQIKSAVNRTATKTISIVADEIRAHLSAKKKYIKRLMRVRIRATSKRPFAEVILRKTARMSVKAFPHSQTKKGVSYKSSPKKGRTQIPGAFISRGRLGGHVFKRVGQARLPIAQQLTASPWGAYKINHLNLPTKKAASAELRKQMERQIRELGLRRKGVIN